VICPRRLNPTSDRVSALCEEVHASGSHSR
jgi:hypothetical protein